MDNILQSLHELEGVNGSIVADSGGQILGYRAHAVYDAELLQQVSKSIVSAIDSVKLLQEDWDAVTAQFTDGKLLIRNLSSSAKAKGRTVTLTVIADARLNISFAGVAIRVAVSKLKGLLEGGIPAPLLLSTTGQLQAAALGQVPVHLHTAVAAASSSLSTSVANAGRQSLPEVASSGLSWSGLSGSSAMSGSGVSVADAASSAFLTVCTKSLARSVGPMAKLFVKEAARKVSPDRPFSRDNAQELIAELSKHIEDAADAAQFRQLVGKSL